MRCSAILGDWLIAANCSGDRVLKAFLLNKIAIGQFLYMKYKVGIKNNNAMIIDIAISRFVFLKYESITKPDRATPAAVLAITAKLLGIFSFKISPLLFKKFFSSLKETLQAFCIMYGTPRIVSQNPIKASLLYSAKDNNTADVNPTVISSQNIRFQKLSLFSRALIKLIMTSLRIFKTIPFILSKFRVWCKIIRLFIVIMVANFSFISCFAQDLAELIDKAEQDYAIPSGLLKSIASIESGNKPYALNISGKSVFASSKEEAQEIEQTSIQQGNTNIDLGVMQINWRWHNEYFNSPQEILEPKTNIEYAAKFLSKLYKQHGSWNKAVRHYHSASPQHHIKYSRRVLISWLGD